MPLNAVATNRCFKGLVCAYLGTPITVRVVASGARRPVYFVSEGAFDPSVPDPDAEHLLKLARTRRGIAGAIPETATLTCPYTGKPLSIKKSEIGYTLEGGFRPSDPVSDPAELAKSLAMRGGELPEGFVPYDTPRVSMSPRDPAPKHKKDADLSGLAQDMVDRTLTDLGAAAPAKISVPGGVPRRKQKKG